MGKHGKKQSLNHRRGKRTSYTLENSEEEGINEYPLSPPASSARGVALSDSDQESQEEEEEENQEQETVGTNAVDSVVPSKFALYQQSVQSPKGDISYLQKFFLMYVGGRAPLHLQEDFCGTALLSMFGSKLNLTSFSGKTEISLHFNLHKQHRKLRHAFSYSWRLWSLPEVKDCLEEAGFRSVHFWIRSMPDSEQIRRTDGLSVGRDVKYEEATSFQQQDSWNAYIVGVA
ncbi:UNVERIFIED_CONTAM: hypothetical protein Sradi_0338500 [Sesamum radiatum]|uniref:Uncharacterized protein n=1 Tax=Sesamum radiatum TaxID=300843 RepID=A0AAW2W626_SESRA